VKRAPKLQIPVESDTSSENDSDFDASEDIQPRLQQGVDTKGLSEHTKSVLASTKKANE